jgi:hypothetical protein
MLKQMPKTDEDKRDFERFIVRLTVKFVNLNNGKEERVVTHDISAKGAGIVTKEEIAKRIPLEMWLDIPDSREPLYVKGEVAWSKMVDYDTWRVGVNFDKADFLGISRILRLR